MARNIKIITFGTFDLFHKGHGSYLKQAKKYGDYLIVVVARGRNVKKAKGILPIDGEKERIKKVKKSGLADLVTLGNIKDRYRVLKKYKPDVIALGYDQKADRRELGAKLREFGLKNTKIVRLKAYSPRLYKSSKISQKEKKED